MQPQELPVQIQPREEGSITRGDLNAWLIEQKIERGTELMVMFSQLGVQDANDLEELDDGDIDDLCNLMKKLEAKRFRKAIEGTRTPLADQVGAVALEVALAF